MRKISYKILFVLQIIFFIQTNLNAQTLTTDKPDYPPGDTAIITGTGFQPGEMVTVQVLHAVADSIPDTGEDHFQWYVTADTLGNFTTKWHVCEDDCLGANLVANADGNSSGRHAEVYFHDALKTDTYPSSFSAFAGTFSYCQGAVAANLSAAWSNTTCNGINNGGNTNIPITITWYKNSINSTSGGTAVQTTTSNAGTTSSVYTPSTNIVGTFYYYVVISWSAGATCAAAGSMTTTATKTLVVNPMPGTPTVLANGSVAFCQGGSVILSSSASAGNQWYNNSGLLAGEINQNLTATTSGSYSVIVTIGSCSSSASAPISVTVNPYPTGGVSILSPNPSTICSGSSTTVKFSGTANASLSYNKNGVVQLPLSLNQGGLFNLSTGPLTSNTSYEVVSVTSNGCTTTSGFSPASLTVTVNQPPVVTGQPVNQTATYGTSANFIVTATGTGLTYQWQEDAGLGFVNISNLANVYSGVTTATLNVERPTVAMSGYKYRVVISGICPPIATSNGAVLSVNKASLTVTADNKNKIYGEADPALTYTASGTLYYGDSYSVISGVNLSTATGSAATTGTHAIVPDGGTAANYNIGYVNGILTVSQRPVTVTADALSKVYGDVDPALTYQVTSGSLVYADAFTGALNRVAGESVSGSPYAIQKGTIANNNYTITYIGANFSITPLPVSVTADGKTKVYGAIDPTLTYSSNPAIGYALPNGELISFTGSLSRVAGENIGTYAINQGSVNNTNYNITYSAADLTVTTLSVSVTADGKTKVYGSVDPSLTYISNPAVGSALANGELVSFTGSLSRVAGENIGTYAINQGSVNNTNYNISYTAADLTVTPLSVSVTADGKTKVYGSVDPSLTYISNPAIGSALANGELISFTGSLSRVAGENVGTYAINQGSVNNTNYNISYTAANLSITPLSVSVTADGKTKVYGSVDPSLTYTSNPAVGSALANGELISFSGSLSRVAGENVGTYTINQGSVNNTNYNISYSSANLTVTPLSVSVTADAKTKIYGSVDPSLTYMSNPTLGSALPNGELISFTGALERVAGEDVSSYPINRGSVNNTNYNITYTGANLVITKAVVTSSVVVSPNPQQYSDRVVYCAIIKGGAPLIAGGPQAGTTVTFKVGSQIIATNVPLIVSGLDIKATYTASLLEPSPYGTSPTGQMAPGTAIVTASINGVNSNYSVSPAQPTTAITILKENDPVYYTGGEFASTGSSTSNVANIRLAASVTDDNDGYPGDIRNARVRFKIQPYNCDISMTPQTIVYTSWRPVSLVNSASTTIGTAYLDTTFNIGTCDAKIYDITVEVGGYYTGNSDVVTVTVAKSMNDFISGGGHLDMGSGTANKSSGVYKSSDNSKTNWGFNVKYNKNKTNLQGNANIIIRSGGNVYQVKGIVGGSNGSLNTNVSDPNNKKATLTAKANMIDLATGLSVNYGSNATLELKMSDKGEPGANIDTYGITIWGSNGSLLYSSNWSGTTNSTSEVIINGGNIQVGSVLSGRFSAPDSSIVDSVNAVQNEPYTVKIFPNPTDKDRISISIFGNHEQTKSAQLYIYDVTGKLIHSDEKFCLQNCSETVLHLDQKYIAGIYLVDVVINGKIYHQKLIVQ